MSISISTLSDAYVLRTSLLLPYPRDEVFSFFADARNLDRITPAQLKFKILNNTPIEMKKGTIIDYALRVHGIPIRWRSEITTWEPPFRFVDEQIRGPYKFWRHEHRFEQVGSGTMVHDEVHYGIFCGAVAHPLIVRSDLTKIFAFRHATLLKTNFHEKRPAL